MQTSQPSRNKARLNKTLLSLPLFVLPIVFTEDSKLAFPAHKVAVLASLFEGSFHFVSPYAHQIP